MSDTSYLDVVLAEGASKAASIADATVNNVYQAMGFLRRWSKSTILEDVRGHVIQVAILNDWIKSSRVLLYTFFAYYQLLLQLSAFISSSWIFGQIS